jgi:hypothetical protein
MLHHVALVRTDILEEPSASSIIRVTRISELGKLAATSNQCMLWRNCQLLLTFLVHRFVSPWWWRCWVSPKRWFLQDPHGITFQKTPFFIVSIVVLMCFLNRIHWVSWICLYAHTNTDCFNMLQVSLWIPVVFLAVCMFLVIVLCYARPFEVGMGVIITLTGLPAFWVGVVWKSKPLWFQHMFCKYYCS